MSNGNGNRKNGNRKRTFSAAEREAYVIKNIKRIDNLPGNGNIQKDWKTQIKFYEFLDAAKDSARYLGDPKRQEYSSALQKKQEQLEKVIGDRKYRNRIAQELTYQIEENKKIAGKIEDAKKDDFDLKEMNSRLYSLAVGKAGEGLLWDALKMKDNAKEAFREAKHMFFCLNLGLDDSTQLIEHYKCFRNIAYGFNVEDILPGIEAKARQDVERKKGKGFVGRIRYYLKPEQYESFVENSTLSEVYDKHLGNMDSVLQGKGLKPTKEEKLAGLIGRLKQSTDFTNIRDVQRYSRNINRVQKAVENRYRKKPEELRQYSDSWSPRICEMAESAYRKLTGDKNPVIAKPENDIALVPLR